MDFLSPLKTAFYLLGNYWWIYAPVLLLWLSSLVWREYIINKYLLSMDWTLLEIKPPPDVFQSPKVAENIFAGIHGIYLAVKAKKQFFEGKVPDWFSFEIVGNSSGMHFYVRTRESLKKLVESQVFSQYPEAEIKEVTDYVNELPIDLPNDDYDLFGAELVFTKENAYPIKTYLDFEDRTGKDEFKQIDPMSSLAETIGLLEPGENILIQILIRPTGNDWVKEAQSVVDKITGKEPKVKQNLLEKTILSIDNIIPGGVAAEPKKEKSEFSSQKLTPGQKYVLEKVENKIAKLGFKSGIRFMYVSRKETFHRSHISSVIGMFKQLYTNDMNSFKPNGATITISDGWLTWLFPSNTGFFAANQTYKRKVNIHKAYRNRSFVQKLFILNTEELATLFHMPNIALKAPAMARVESRKGQPPITLPTG